MKENEKKGISLYIANLGKYNEGVLQGGWVDLPVTQEELDGFMAEKVGLCLDAEEASKRAAAGERVYEEYAIHDFDKSGLLKSLGMSPGEYDSLDDWNRLAVIAASEEFDPEVVRGWISSSCSPGAGDDPIAVASVILQHDEIPYRTLERPYEGASDMVSLVHTMVQGSEAEAKIQGLDETSFGGHHLSNYFDMESCGESHAKHLAMLCGGFIDPHADGPDPDFYDRNEICEIAEERMAAPAASKSCEGQRAGAPAKAASSPAADAKRAAASAAARTPQATPTHDMRKER